MKTARLLTTAALAVVITAPIVAVAQPTYSAPPAAGPVNPPASAAPATSAGVPAAATTRNPNAPIGSEANPIPLNSPTPTTQASGLVAGDPTVVSNSPVPDTKANRARFGQPLSAAGRATRPAGND